MDDARIKQGIEDRPVKCPNCGSDNLAGALHCKHCGALFDSRLGTRQVEPPDVQPADGRNWGTAKFGQTAKFILYIPFDPEEVSLTLTLPDKGSLVLGRCDPLSTRQPDIDLAPYNARELGVSRSHVAIRRDGDILFIRDLQSTNGTYINGTRLLPQVPRVLCDGDRIRLGEMVIAGYFG